MPKERVKMTRVKSLFDLFKPPSGIYITFSNYLPLIGIFLLPKTELGIVSNQPNCLFPPNSQHFKNKIRTYSTFALPYFLPISFLRGQYICIKPRHPSQGIKIFRNIKNVLPQVKNLKYQAYQNQGIQTKLLQHQINITIKSLNQ